MSITAAGTASGAAAPADLEAVMLETEGPSSGLADIRHVMERARAATSLRRIALWVSSPDTGEIRPLVHIPTELEAVARAPVQSGPAEPSNQPFTARLGHDGSEGAVLVCEPGARGLSREERLFLRGVAHSLGARLERRARLHGERMAAAAAARADEVERLAALGSWRWEISADRVTWSENLFRMSRSEASTASIGYATFLEYIHPDDREEVNAVVAAALAGESPWEFQARALRQDGSAGWIQVRALVERDADGRPVSVLGTTQDITELRRTQEALRTSEGRFRGLFMQFPFSVQIFDPEGRTLQVNPAFESFWGYGLEALEGFNPLTEPQLEPIREAIARGFAGETVFLPPILFDGSRIAESPDPPDARWVQAFMFPVRDPAGRLREVILVHQDVTHERRAEEHLRVSEESYRTIFDLASDGIFVHHPVTGAVLDVNLKASELHGMSVEELKRAGLDAITDGSDPRSKERAVEFIRRAAAGEPQRFEWLIQRGDGRVWVEVSLNNVSILGEERVLANVRDIHQRKTAEAALRQANEELEARVAERTTELQEANRALSDSVADHELARTELTRRTEELEGIFQALPDLYFRLSGDGRILHHRSGTDQDLYVPPEQFLGRRITEVLPEEASALIAGCLDEVERTGTLAVVEYPLTEDGETFEYEARILPLPDGSRIGIVRDITARKRAERKLQAREERFRLLIENAYDLVQVLDAAGRVLYTGPSVERLLGYRAEDLVGSDPLEIIDEADREAIRVSLGEILKTPGIVRSAQYRIQHRDGSWRVFEAFGRTIVSDAGDPGIVVNARDVTERRRIEEALRDSEEHFRRLIENAHDMVVIMDSRGMLQYGSPSVRRILGYDPDALRERESMEFIHPDDLSLVEAQLARMSAEPGTPARIECRFRHSDGSWRHLEAVGTPMSPDDPGTSFVFNVRDVTERHAAEDALREREEHFRSLIENAHDITCICDERGYMLYQSPSLERRLGYTPEELIGRSGFPYIHPEDVPAAEDALRSMIASPGTVVRLEYRFRHRDGEWRMLEAFGRTLLQDSASGGVVLNIRDVTERKMTERALGQAMQEAERAREAAERANRAKSEFLSRMSHELRTPMNSILGFGQLLDRADMPADQRRGIQHILKAGRHLLQLINEVLEIARIEAGKQNFSLEPVRLRGAMQEAISLVRPLAAQRGIELEDGPWENGEAFVQADRQRLVQVLLNLLSNAVKYNRVGGRVSLSCGRPDPALDGRVAVRVEDTGPGIPHDRQDELFTPFSRLGAEQTEVEGTGLGLALSQRLAAAMAGDLQLERSGTDGTVFRLELVAASDPVEVLDDGAGRSRFDLDTDHSPAKLLYIEDNLANLSLVESILALRPMWRTIPALQGRLGAELAIEHQPNLILLDLHLPDLPGEEVFRRLRADLRTKDIPIIVISADATRASQDRLLASGADAYLTKPLDVDEFLATLDRFLESRP